MFTKEQIQQAQAKSKGGKDFPQLVQDFKALRILLYEHWVGNGVNIYLGADNYAVKIESGQALLNVSDNSSAEKLKQALKIHQAGETDYPTFCLHSAEAGVEKWVTDISELTVTYLDKKGNTLVLENIPTL
jgi:uncharacterized protein YbcV (DUF1398 family)